MKKTSFFAWALAALGIMSCNSFETSNNGKIDGFWQLAQVDTLALGRAGDVRECMIFWSVQHTMIELSDLRPESTRPSVFFSFEYTGDSLKLLGEPRPVVNNRRISDRFAESQDVSYYGLDAEGEKFKVLQLGEEKMTLQSERLRMHFRRY